MKTDIENSAFHFHFYLSFGHADGRGTVKMLKLPLPAQTLGAQGFDGCR